MRFEFRVKAEVERVEGKFATRADVEELLEQSILDADPGQIDTAEATYDTIEWETEAVESDGRPSKRSWTQDHLARIVYQIGTEQAGALEAEIKDDPPTKRGHEERILQWTRRMLTTDQGQALFEQGRRLHLKDGKDGS